VKDQVQREIDAAIAEAIVAVRRAVTDVNLKVEPIAEAA